MKKINVLAITAMLIGGGFALNANAKNQAANERFGQDQNGVWHKISDLSPGSYSCEGMGICSAEYTSDPRSPGANPEELRVPNTAIDGALLVD